MSRRKTSYNGSANIARKQSKVNNNMDNSEEYRAYDHPGDYESFQKLSEEEKEREYNRMKNILIRIEPRETKYQLWHDMPVEDEGNWYDRDTWEEMNEDMNKDMMEYEEAKSKAYYTYDPETKMYDLKHLYYLTKDKIEESPELSISKIDKTGKRDSTTLEYEIVLHKTGMETTPKFGEIAVVLVETRNKPYGNDGDVVIVREVGEKMVTVVDENGYVYKKK